MIPKRIHRIWLDDPMPEQFEANYAALVRLHPDWEVTDWRGTPSLPPLRNQALFDRASHITADWKRFQADILRLELLWLYGGVYLDTDVRPLKPFDALLDVGCFLGYSPNAPNVVTNAVMGAVPSHPFIGRCIDTLPESVERYKGRPLAQMAGPWHLNRQLTPDVVVHPSTVFYPQSIAQRDRGERPDLTYSYTHHTWNTTARKRGLGV